METAAANNDNDRSIPHDEFHAHALVQKYSLMENRKTLDSRFFDAVHRRGFAKVGIHAAWHCSLIWVIAYVVLGSIAYSFPQWISVEATTTIGPFTFNATPLYWAVKFASFITVSVSTGICFSASRFYAGNVPRKAIFTWFTTRGIFLVSFSLVTFLFLGLAYQHLLNDTAIVKVYNVLSRVNERMAYRVCAFFYTFLRRYLFEAGMAGVLASFFGAVLPFLGIAFFRVAKRKKKTLGIDRRR